DRAEAEGIRVRRYGRGVAGPDDARVLGYSQADGAGRVQVALSGPGGRGEVPEKLDVAVAVPGEHMAYNAVAALLAGLELGAPAAGLLDGLAAFGGVRRRFEF